VVACCVGRRQFAAFIDTAICLIMPFADRAGLPLRTNGVLSPCDITTYSILMGYLTARLEHDLSSLVTDRGEQLTAVVAVVAVLVSPTILNDCGWSARRRRVRDLARNQQLLGRASSTVGEENAHAVCHIQIFVTDRDQRAVSC
jgi:hypothetical protein